jgi:hypothetical protein|tara:strand:+ start:3299 stop:3481 length:183 start_codon:yes stop_codon:yes gene_type:complete
MKKNNKLEKQVMADGILLYLEQLNQKEILSVADKKKFNTALDIALKYNLKIMDWENERKS